MRPYYLSETCILDDSCLHCQRSTPIYRVMGPDLMPVMDDIATMAEAKRFIDLFNDAYEQAYAAGRRDGERAASKSKVDATLSLFD